MGYASGRRGGVKFRAARAPAHRRLSAMRHEARRIITLMTVATPSPSQPATGSEMDHEDSRQNFSKCQCQWPRPPGRAGLSESARLPP
jgi:hypothetical protein